MPARWSYGAVKDEALKHTTRTSFQKHKAGAHKWAWKHGVLDEVCSHMDLLMRPDWTADSARQEALKYRTRKSFRKSSAYEWARKTGILDEISEHMEWVNRPNGFWNLANAQKEAMKFSSRAEFYRNSPAYKWAWRNNALDKICGHMVENQISDRDTIYVFRVVNVKYQNLPVYKVGLTSARLGQERIKLIAQKNKFNIELLVIAMVSDAPTLEKILHELGIPADITKGDGRTEFRAMNKRELETALQFINSESTLANTKGTEND